MRSLEIAIERGENANRKRDDNRGPQVARYTYTNRTAIKLPLKRAVRGEGTSGSNVKET